MGPIGKCKTATDSNKAVRAVREVNCAARPLLRTPNVHTFTMTSICIEMSAEDLVDEAVQRDEVSRLLGERGQDVCARVWHNLEEALTQKPELMGATTLGRCMLVLLEHMPLDSQEDLCAVAEAVMQPAGVL